MARCFVLIFAPICFLAVWTAGPAQAQELAATVGVHRTSADVNSAASSVDGKLNYKAGLVVGFDLAENMKFRSGLIYNQRHIDVVRSGIKYKYQFDYFDVPANLQYNLNETFGFFGGLVISALVNDGVDAPAGASPADPDAEALLAHLNLGINLMFNDMVGFDFYYERGMGGFAYQLENYGSFGGNFLYWF